MRRYSGVIILGGIAVLLATVYFWVNGNTDPALVGRMFSVDESDSIQEIILKNQYGEFLFVKEDDSWMLKEPGNYHVSKKKSALLEKALLDLRVNRSLESELPEYGLREPAVELEFTTRKNEKHTLLVGNLAPSNAQIYLKDAETGKIYIADIGMTAQFDGSLAAYRGKEVFSIDKEQITELTYLKNGEKQVTVHYYGPQDWRLTYPFTAPARYLELSELNVNMRKWIAAGYPGELNGNYAQVGLDNPTESLVITDAAGKTQTLEFGKVEDGMIYTRTGSEEDILKLFEVDVDFSGFTVDQLLFVAPLQTPIGNVASITISSPQVSSTFMVDHSKDPLEVTLLGKPLPVEDFVALFVKYIGFTAIGYDPEGKPGDEILSLSTAFIDGTTQTVKVHKRSEDTYFMDIPGAQGFYVSEDEVNQLVDRWENLLAKAD